WIARLAEHGNGITLLHARTEAGWFEPIWQRAAAILFLADRIHFHRPDGSRQPANSGAFSQRLATKRCRGCTVAALVVRLSLDGTINRRLCGGHRINGGVRYEQLALLALRIPTVTARRASRLPARNHSHAGQVAFEALNL